jgi:hypothetical protein
MKSMTLLEAVESLGLIEVAAVSWIYVIRVHTRHVAVFTIAYLLPFLDTDLPDEFRAGKPRLWPDQKRILESTMPIEDQILELHRTRTFGNLAQVYRTPGERGAHRFWSIRTHGGNDQERLTWMESVIALEGRSPVRRAEVIRHTQESYVEPPPVLREKGLDQDQPFVNTIAIECSPTVPFAAVASRAA